MDFMLPNDPAILLSVINTRLRDYYSSLDALCEDMNVNKEELIKKLSLIGYEYKEERNQFV
ncbi:MAG: DUF4250 domain-containing protein [Clostridia bacterium]|nr:DUF4250 domain-containing protein [Clostridia bacterium]